MLRTIVARILVQSALWCKWQTRGGREATILSEDMAYTKRGNHENH